MWLILIGEVIMLDVKIIQLSEAENVIFNSNNEVEKIGKINTGQ